MGKHRGREVEDRVYSQFERMNRFHKTKENKVLSLAEQLEQLEKEKELAFTEKAQANEEKRKAVKDEIRFVPGSDAHYAAMLQEREAKKNKNKKKK